MQRSKEKEPKGCVFKWVLLGYLISTWCVSLCYSLQDPNSQGTQRTWRSQGHSKTYPAQNYTDSEDFIQGCFKRGERRELRTQLCCSNEEQGVEAGWGVDCRLSMLTSGLNTKGKWTFSIHHVSEWKSLSCVQLFATSWTIQSMNSPGQNTGVGSLSLLQGIFPTQGSNLGFPHCRWILYHLSHKGSPISSWQEVILQPCSHQS